MKLKAILSLALLIAPTIVQANNDTIPADKNITFSYSGYGEVGVTYNNDGWGLLNPYILAGGEVGFKRGWSVYGEIEYADKFSLTQFYVTKSFTDYANVSLGKMTIPIGIFNVYDNPMDHFTISLPQNELFSLPEECTAIGASFHGTYSTINYNVMGLMYEDDDIAVAARIGNQFTEQIDASLTGFYDGEFVVSADINYLTDSFITRAIANYSQHNNAVYTGVEAGYDMFSLSSKTKGSLFLFGRYDFTHHHSNCHRTTLGLNYRPIRQIVVKTEYARNFQSGNSYNEFSLGVGVSLP